MILKFMKIFYLLNLILLTSCSYTGQNEEQIKSEILSKTPYGMSMSDVRDVLVIDLKLEKSIIYGLNVPCRKVASNNPTKYEELSKHMISAKLGSRVSGVIPQHISAIWCFDDSEKLIDFNVSINNDGI